MSAAERRAVIDALPTSIPEELAPPPEGDPHRKPKSGAVAGLDDLIFAPDVLAVAVVREPEELERLERLIDELVHRRGEAETARSEAEAARSDAERKLAEALAEIERLKRER